MWIMGSVNSHERKQTNQIIHFSLVLFVFLLSPRTPDTDNRVAGSSLLSFILGCTYMKLKEVHTSS